MSLVSNGRHDCSVCNLLRITYECKGCTNDFCYKHLTEHRQFFIEELIKVEDDRDQFHETLIQQKNNIPNHLVIQQINKWENDALKKIKQTAEECRQIFVEHAIQSYSQIEFKLNKLNDDIEETKIENEFNEIVLEQLKAKLAKLIEELSQAPNAALQQESSPYISKIFVASTSGESHVY